jgi:hypothetical protein
VQQSLVNARRWVDARIKIEGRCSKADAREVEREIDAGQFPFTHRAAAALRAPWQSVDARARHDR